MLKKEEVFRENAIEEIVYLELKKCRQHPMSNEDAMLLINLSALPTKGFCIEEKEKPFIYKLIEKRVSACMSFSISDKRILILLCGIIETPAIAVLYVWYLQGWCFENGVRDLDLNTICLRVFPNGFLSEEDLKRVWDSQKVERHNGSDSDNLVDYVTAGKSIQFKNEN